MLIASPFSTFFSHPCVLLFPSVFPFIFPLLLSFFTFSSSRLPPLVLFLFLSLQCSSFHLPGYGINSYLTSSPLYIVPFTLPFVLPFTFTLIFSFSSSLQSINSYLTLSPLYIVPFTFTFVLPFTFTHLIFTFPAEY